MIAAFEKIFKWVSGENEGFSMPMHRKSISLFLGWVIIKNIDNYLYLYLN
jgi:hypothetical protein